MNYYSLLSDISLIKWKAPLLFIQCNLSKMKTPKKAKCDRHTLSFCNTKHDAPECTNCVLVQRRERLYKFVNGHKLKRCPQCGEYKMLHEFKVNSAGHRSCRPGC